MEYQICIDQSLSVLVVGLLFLSFFGFSIFDYIADFESTKNARARRAKRIEPSIEKQTAVIAARKYDPLYTAVSTMEGVIARRRNELRRKARDKEIQRRIKQGINLYRNSNKEDVVLRNAIKNVMNEYRKVLGSNDVKAE